MASPVSSTDSSTDSPSCSAGPSSSQAARPRPAASAMAAASAALPVNTDMSFSGWWQGLVAGLLQALVLGALQRFGFVAFNGPARFLSALLNLADRKSTRLNSSH